MSENSPLPLFPLHLFLLPGEKTQLHIFEDRYKTLVNDCMEGTNSFGLACNARENTFNLGSLVRISKVLKRYPGGESDIEIVCYGLFRLKKFFYRLEEAPYPGGYVEIYRNPLFEKPIAAPSAAVQRQASLLDIAIGLQLDVADKLRFARIQDGRKQQHFVESRKRLMALLLEQERARYEDLLYLN